MGKQFIGLFFRSRRFATVGGFLQLSSEDTTGFSAVEQMTDADVFGKLSRIFETHAFSGEEDIDDLLEDLDTAHGYHEEIYSPTSSRRSPMSPKRL